jgi:hypothetical protein
VEELTERKRPDGLGRRGRKVIEGPPSESFVALWDFVPSIVVVKRRGGIERGKHDVAGVVIVEMKGAEVVGGE